MTPALFLDRDGVINHDAGYTFRSDQVRFVDGVFDLCAAARRLAMPVIVVTNQAGVARGYYTEADVRRLHAWMQERFAEQNAPIEAFYYCPFHPDGVVARYTGPSPDRKPNPGMILRAAAEKDLDLTASCIVGDKPGDLEAGRRAGVGKRVLFDASLPPTLARQGADYACGDLRSIIPLLPANR